jgi:hypothetical protein
VAVARNSKDFLQQNPGMECAFEIDREYNEIPKVFSDTIGASINHRIVNIMHKASDAFFPDEAMEEELAKLPMKKL